MVVLVVVRSWRLLACETEVLENAFHQGANRWNAAHDDDNPSFCGSPDKEGGLGVCLIDRKSVCVCVDNLFQWYLGSRVQVTSSVWVNAFSS
jgi:hypothetical protein